MNLNISRFTIIILAMLMAASSASARKLHSKLQTVPPPDIDTLSWYRDVVPTYELLIDREDFDSIISNPTRQYFTLPKGFYGEPVFDKYRFLEPISLIPAERDPNFAQAYEWLDDINLSAALLDQTRQRYMIDNPQLIRYNINDLPEPPKQYRAFVNPLTTRIEFQDMKVAAAPIEADIERKVWIGKFTASLQFSQAYISPNWYQGGNNNLNMLGQFAYNLQLNQKFYPRYLFNMTVQYKIGLNSTPDDSIRSYSISEDLFQFNLTTGVKAFNKWFYSGTVNFKTQFFNSYPLNSRSIKSSFLSPGELNVGLGMTYNTTNKKKNFTLALSVSPLSWNLKTCINNRVNEQTYGIKPGRNASSEVGSSLECNIKWKLAYNISYASRIFAFTDYSYLQADWEHTLDFAINRYLSTRLYLHMRYDTQTPRVADSNWHKFQFKEILSFGFNYTFSTVK